MGSTAPSRPPLLSIAGAARELECPVWVVNLLIKRVLRAHKVGDTLKVRRVEVDTLTSASANHARRSHARWLAGRDEVTDAGGVARRAPRGARLCRPN